MIIFHTKKASVVTCNTVVIICYEAYKESDKTLHLPLKSTEHLKLSVIHKKRSKKKRLPKNK